MTELIPENMSLAVDHEKRRILFSQSGLLDKESILLSYRLLLGMDGFDPSYDTLADYQDVKEVDLGLQDFREILNEVKEIEVRTGNGALIIGRNVGRMILGELFCEFNDMTTQAEICWKPFKTVSDAEKWLESEA